MQSVSAMRLCETNNFLVCSAFRYITCFDEYFPCKYNSKCPSAYKGVDGTESVGVRSKDVIFVLCSLQLVVVTFKFCSECNGLIPDLEPPLNIFFYGCNFSAVKNLSSGVELPTYAMGS